VGDLGDRTQGAVERGERGDAEVEEWSEKVERRGVKGGEGGAEKN
jgi:hypothetical protein